MSTNEQVHSHKYRGIHRAGGKCSSVIQVTLSTIQSYHVLQSTIIANLLVEFGQYDGRCDTRGIPADGVSKSYNLETVVYLFNQILM